MAPTDWPLVGRVYALGVNPISTTLVLLGPVVILVIAILGRSTATIALGIGYVSSLPGSVAYFAATGGGDRLAEDQETDDETTGNGDDGT